MGVTPLGKGEVSTMFVPIYTIVAVIQEEWQYPLPGWIYLFNNGLSWRRVLGNRVSNILPLKGEIGQKSINK